MPKRVHSRGYNIFHPPTLASSELVCKVLSDESTNGLIDKWLEHRNDAYWQWFQNIRDRRSTPEPNVPRSQQLLMWNKGTFAPEQLFVRTLDTGRVIALDRTWKTHLYHHSSLLERNLSMMPVVFTMLPELMLLRGMHDHRCDDIYIVVTDLKRQEMDDVTNYFQMVCRHAFGKTCKPSMERRIRYEHMRLSHTLVRQHRTPCFPQLDLIVRAILYDKRPPFLVLFSHQTNSYTQILFTHESFVPSEDIFFDFPSGCPNPCCTEDCDLIRFPRRGVNSAAVLDIRFGRRVVAREMCNWIDCDVCFDDAPSPGQSSTGSDDGASVESTDSNKVVGLKCSRCCLVKYCSSECQTNDWSEHRRVCVKPSL